MSLRTRDLEQITKTNAAQAVQHPNDVAKDAAMRPPVACSLREIHSNLIARLAGIREIEIPRMRIDVDPDDIRDVNPYILLVAKHFDGWLADVGAELRRNGAMVDMTLFTDQAALALQGNATFEIESAALAMEEDRGRK